MWRRSSAAKADAFTAISIALLTILKGLPLSYNRDLQEDKPPFFDTVDTLQGCLAVAGPMIATMVVRADRMRALCDRGFLAATELADYLTEKGIPFRTAHGVVKRVVAYCEGQHIRLDELTLEELRRFDAHFDAGALQVLSIDQVVHVKDSYGGTSPRRVREQIAKLKKLSNEIHRGCRMNRTPLSDRTCVHIAYRRRTSVLYWRLVAGPRAPGRRSLLPRTAC